MEQDTMVDGWVPPEVEAVESSWTPPEVKKASPQSDIPTVTLSDQEVAGGKPETNLPIPSPSQYQPRLRLSGKDIGLMQKATDAAFSTSDIFKGEKGQRNKDIYYSALLKQGYTPDDVALIKGEQPEKYTSVIEEKTSAPQTQTPYSVTVTDMNVTPYDRKTAVLDFGGSKNYAVYQGTQELFKSDPSFEKQDKREAYYQGLKENGYDPKSLNLLKNNIENQITQDRLEKGKGFNAIVNPAGASAEMSKEMFKAGHEAVTDKQEYDKLKKVIADEGLGSGALVATKAALDIAMGVLTVTPPGIAFSVGINVASEIAPKAVEYISSWPSHIAKAVGRDVENASEGVKAYWGILDFMGFAVAVGGGKKSIDWSAKKAKEVLDPTSKENAQMQIRDLERRFGKLTAQQRDNAAQLWYNMRAQDNIKPLTEQHEVVKPPTVLAAEVLDKAVVDQQKVKAEYEQGKAQMDKPVVEEVVVETVKEPVVEKPNTPEQVQTTLLTGLLPKMQEYVEGFDITTPINEVASGLSVKYQGKNGKLGRDETTGEITFTDYSNGKTEIISGGGDVTSFADKGLRINEGYFEDYYVEGDANGYTVYKVTENGLKPAFEGEKANVQRRDAIIRKALGKTPLTIEAEKAADKVLQLQNDWNKSKGTPAEPILAATLEMAKKDAAIKGEEAIVEQHAQAMERVVEVELREQIEQLEITSESLSDAGKQAIAPEISQARTILKEMEAKNEVAPEGAMESKPGDPIGIRSQEAAASPIPEPTKAGSGGGDVNIKSSWESNIEALVRPETGLAAVTKKILDAQQPLKDAFLKRVGLSIDDYRKLDENGKQKVQDQWVKSKEFEQLSEQSLKEPPKSTTTPEGEVLGTKTKQNGKDQTNEKGGQKRLLETETAAEPKTEPVSSLSETTKPKQDAIQEQGAEGLAYTAEVGGAKSKGVYLADEGVAKSYGEEGAPIVKYKYKLKNPLIIEKDGDFDVVNKLINDYQKENPNAKFHPDITDHVNKELEKLGYDGLIIKKEALDTEKGYNDIGGTYGEPQIVVFDRKSVSVENPTESPVNKVVKKELYRVVGMPTNRKGKDFEFYGDENVANEYAAMWDNTTVIKKTVEYKNPLKVDLIDEQFSDPQYESKYLEQAKKEGYDAVIFKNKETGQEHYAILKNPVKTPVEKSVETPPEPSPKQPVETPPQSKPLTSLEQAKSRLAAAKEAASKLRDVSKLGTMSDPFKKAEEQAKADRAMHEAYIEVAIEYLKDKTIKAAKTLENFAKYLEEEITDTINTAWEDAVNADNQKGVLGHAMGAKNFTEQVKLKIVENGLNYEPRIQKDAAKSADKFIASIGAEDAVIQAMNRSNAIHGDVRTMIMARAIEYWHDIEVNAKTPESKNRAADMQADILDNLDMLSRDIGQQISALNEFYTTSPIGFERYIKKKEKRISEEILHQKPRGGTSRLTKIKNSQEALTTGATQAAAKATGKQAKKIFEKKPSLSIEEVAEKKALRSEFMARINDVTNIPALLFDKKFIRYGELIVKESAGDFREFSKRAIKELGEKVKPILNDWYVKAGGKDYKAAESIGKKAIKSEGIDIARLAEDHFLEANATKEKLIEKLIDQMGLDPKQAKEIAENLSFYFDKTVAEKRMEVLNRIFPPPKATSLAGKVGVKVRQRENDKIVKAINAGAFDSKKFEKLFYEKFGILDIESPEIAAKLKDFSRRLYQARNKNNPLFYDRVYQDMLDFIEDKRRSKAIQRLGDKVITQMYANMLYGYETHIRNTSFNIVKSLAGITSSMASNPKYAPEFLKAFVKELYRGKLEAGEIMKQGYRKSGDPVIEARGIAERINGAWSKYAVVPFRALSAMDAGLNFPSRGMKTYQYLIEDAIKANDAKPKDLRKTKSEIVDDVNELMGYDIISDKAAHSEAMAQIKNEYGVSDLWIDGKRNPKYKAASHNRMYRDYERSVFNIKESSRPEDVVEQAKDWADNALLMGKPRGWFGVVAHGFNAIGRAVPALKVMVTPFVNVPLNVAAHMVEFSPLGFATAFRGKEAMFLPKEEAKRWGIEQELLPRKQRQLMAKAAAGSVGMGVVYSLTKMEYYDADEKKVRPVLIVYGDGTGNYTDNKKLENLPGSEKFREYSADFMGQRFSYKVNPFAPWFLPAGAMHDYDQYRGGKDKEFSDKFFNELWYTTVKYMVFIKDQAAVQGLMDLLGVSASIPKNSTEEAAGQMVKDKLKDQVAKTIRTLTIPNTIPQAMRDYKGLTGGIESGGYRFIDRLAKDVPFADQFVGKNEDHFGDPIGEKFEIPSVVGDERPDNKYYKMAKDHDYLEKLRFYSDRTLWINGQNKILTNGQIDAINKLRNRKAGKVIKDDFDRLNDMNNEDFSTEMNLIYRQAQAEAMDELFGIDGWSNTNPLLKNNSTESSNSEVEEEMPEPQEEFKEEFEQVDETIEQ